MENDDVAKEVSYILNGAFQLLAECEKVIGANLDMEDEKTKDLLRRLLEYRLNIHDLFRK